MTSEKTVIGTLTGRGLPLPGGDIDTDRIIPARYLRCVTFEGLGEFAFQDERFGSDGAATDHPLNDARYEGAEILVVGSNFGCGSSREHAPQSLMRFGFRAIVGESFSEIFAGNCTAIGIPTVTLVAEEIRELMSLLEEDPQTVASIDLEERTVSAGDKSWACDMPEPQRQALLSGHWDTTGILLERCDEIRRKAQELPYLQWAIRS